MANMSRRGNAASTARNAPFGTDIQATVKTKIIGGKTIEIHERTPLSSASSQPSSQSLQSGPHGTPPMQYQAPLKESNNNSYNNSPDPLPGSYRKIYSQTAPRDTSNSHIHSKGRQHENRPGASRALPPIHQSSYGHNHGDDEDIPSSDDTPPPENPTNIKDLLQKPFPVHLASSPVLSPIDDRRSLTEQVAQHLANYDPMHFREMYTDLAEFDHGLQGFVSQPQMNMIAHKHKLPIPITTLRLLFANFAKGSNPDQVNYERLVQFLARAQLGSAKAQTLLEDSVQKFVHEASPSSQTNDEVARLDNQIRRYEENEEAERREQERQIEEARKKKNQKEQEKWKPSFTTKKPLRTFSELDDAKLIRMLEEQFSDGKKKQTIDIDGMREMCLKKDRQKQGTFTRRDLDDLFLFYRIPIQGSLLNKMIQRIDTGHDQLSWVAFLEILERVQSGDAMTPRGEADSNKNQRRASEGLPAPNVASPGKRNSFFRTNGSKDTTRNRSRDGTKPLRELAPVIEPKRPSTWPKRPIKEVLPTPQDPKEVSSPPWHRKPLARIETSRNVPQPNDVSDVEMEITRNDTPTEDHVTPPLPPNPDREEYEIEQLRRMAQDHGQGNRRATERQAEAAMTRQRDDKREREEWFKGFLHLAKGLFSTDSAKTGCLNKDEMLRLVNNYNLIYQLGLSSSHIKRVVETCCHEGDDVPIQPVVEILRQRKK